MADQISARVLSGPTIDALKRVQREVQKANVAAVRAAGQALAADARRRAPVYQGPRRDVPKGRLRKSIKAGRVKRIGTTEASVLVGPRGPVVHLYAGAEEARAPYMAPAERDSRAAVAAIAEAAYKKAIEQGAR